jgi:GNAT superfamily N-acetyltransferase
MMHAISIKPVASVRELAAPLLHRILPLVPSHRIAGHMAFVHAVIDGTHPGTVFVDRARNPGSALVFNHAGFGFALGAPRRDLVAPMLRELLEQPWIAAQPTALWCTAPAWADALRPLFCEERHRDEFHFSWRRAPPPVALPPGCSLLPLDVDLVTRWGEGLDPWVVNVWGGAHEFVLKSFGVGIVRDGQLVAECSACAIGGPAGAREAEIEIGTTPAHQRNGLATAAAVAFFDQCRERGLVPAWTCDSRNLPSRRAAARLGFRRFRRVVGYRLRSDALADRAGPGHEL